MKSRGEIVTRINYCKTGEAVARKMVEEVTEEVKEVLTKEDFGLIMKWLAANVSMACHIARQEELKWIIGE